MTKTKKSLTALAVSTAVLFGGIAPAQAADLGPLEGSKQGAELLSDALLSRESTNVGSEASPTGSADMEAWEIILIITGIAAAAGIVSAGVSTNWTFR